MTLVREFNLYLNAGKSIPLVINANQYDSGEQWVFTLYTDSGVQYTPSSGAIVGIKSDNLGIINTGTVDGQGRVVINETQQMTAAAGKAVFELMIDSQTHGTANFVVLVEPKPGDNADLSESDLSLIQQAIDSTSPTVIAETVSDWLDEHITNPTNPAIDTSLSVAGAAADAKATGDAIAAIEQGGGDGLTEDIKQALLQLAQKVAYIDENGQDYYDDLYDALYPPIVVTAITLNTNSLSFATLNSTQQLTATTTPVGGEITWSSSNTSVATVSQTGVVTAIAYGNATITATSGSVSATCSVSIAQATVTSISAVYTQSGTVYDTDSLDSLKSDLVVTATWSNSSTSTVASTDYTLSGTLTEGTSTITVSYSGKTTTFTVTVTHDTRIVYNNFGYTDGKYFSAYSKNITDSETSSITDFIDTQGASVMVLPETETDFQIGFYTTADASTKALASTRINYLSSFDVPINLKTHYLIFSGASDALKAWLANGFAGRKDGLIEGWQDGVAYPQFDLVPNSYATTDGNIKASDTWTRTNFIDCHGASTITFAGFGSGTAANRKYNDFFDEYRTFISGFTIGTSDTTITVPEGAYYFVVSGDPDIMATFVAGSTIPHED